MSTTQPYPFDYDTMEKGDIIPVERLEELSGVERNHTSFGLHVMAFREMIMNEMMARDNPVVVRSNHGSLEILTDAQAYRYNFCRAETHYKGLALSVSRQGWIDVKLLNEEDKAEHERLTMIQSRMYLGAKKGRKKAFKLIATTRNTPELLSAPTAPTEAPSAEPTDESDAEPLEPSP